MYIIYIYIKFKKVINKITMKNLFLCVDIGQTRLKIAVYDANLKLKLSDSTSLQTIIKKEGNAERDMNYLWDIFLNIVKKNLNQNKSIAKGLTYICLCAHGDGIFPIDQRGEPTRNAIISMDTRARQISDRFNHKNEKKLLILIGQLTAANNPAMIIKWLSKNEPKILKNTRWFLYCKDWIKYKLTGLISTDISSASAGLTNVKNGFYSNEIFKLYNLSGIKSKFPKIKPSNNINGLLKNNLKKKLGISQDVRVLEGFHDVSAAMVGMNCLDDHKLLMIGGTFGITQTLSNKKIINKNILCRTSYESKKWLNISYTPSCANTIDWILNISNFRINNLEKIITDRLNKGGNKIIFIPYLYGGQTGRLGYGKFNYIEGGHQSEDLILSVIEGVIFSLAKQVFFMDSKFRVKNIIATGGIFKIRIITQILANLTKKNIYFYQNVEAGVFGCAISCLSLMNNKKLKNKQLKPGKEKIVKPNKINFDYLFLKYKIFLKEEKK